MNSSQSTYAIWTWIVALILAFFLLWAFLTGRVTSGTCCLNATPAAVVAKNTAAPSL